jgi:UDP-N-acetylglucosamine:LPS N-acetylglucosamine transferase
MAEAVERLDPGVFDIRVSDYMKEVGAVDLDRFHKDGWRTMLRWPLLARVGQRMVDANPGLTVALQSRLLRSFARAAAGDLKASPPALVVANHGLLTSGFAEAKRLYGLDVPVVVFATEPHGISAYWSDPRADLIIVPSEETKVDLLRFGVPEEKMEVVGYPVRDAFLNPSSKGEAREKLGLRDAFTCLVSMGGEGVSGDALRAVRTLVREVPQVVVVTGRNRALEEELGGFEGAGGRLVVEGYVEDMAARLAASDVFVGKAGPASVYEALAVGRPVLMTGYTAFNELGVVRFVESRGLGRFVPGRRGSGALVEAVRRYARDEGLLREVASRCRELGLPEQTERLARRISLCALSEARRSLGGDG